MKYTDEMTAACLGISVEQYRAAYKGAAGSKQNALACAAVKQALAGRGKQAQQTLAKRSALIKEAA